MALSSPILMYPHIRTLRRALLVLSLQRSIQLGVARTAHEETSPPAGHLGAEATAPTLHEPAHECGRDGRELVVSQAPISF